MYTGDGGAEGGADGEALPRAFGRYQLFDRIGRGGMADIYLARAATGIGASRRVVVKQILPRLGGDPAFARMLIAEAKLAARLSHANVVQVFDLGTEQGRLFIAMEYVEGFDLHQLLRRLSKQRLPLPAEFAILIVREMLRALDYAHRARDDRGAPLRLVHRDVSPSNVLISFEGEVKLCDFGIARALGEHEHADAEDEAAVARARVAGKSAYMSPEHARGEELDARADVFAAGILLWELCAGRRLYKGTDQEMLAMAREARIPVLPDRGLPQHERLQQVLDDALAPDRDDRFPTARDFLLALEDWAVDVNLLASQIRFGTWLREHFGGEIVDVRRERERVAQGADEPGAELPPAAAGDFLETSVADTRRLPSIPPPAPVPAGDAGGAAGTSWWVWLAAAAIVLGATGFAAWVAFQ